MKAKLTLKKEQMAPVIRYWGKHTDGEENIVQLVPLTLRRIHSVSLMMLPNGLHSSISNNFGMMKLQKCW